MLAGLDPAAHAQWGLRTGANVIVENRSGGERCDCHRCAQESAGRRQRADVRHQRDHGGAYSHAQTPGFDLEKDLTPIALTGATATAFVVSSTLGVRSLGEYVAWVKKNPGKADLGNTAPGSNTHFFGVPLGQAIGVPASIPKL